MQTFVVDKKQNGMDRIAIIGSVSFLSGQRSSHGHHRCVTHLYRIPVWSFDCVIGKMHFCKILMCIVRANITSLRYGKQTVFLFYF